MANAILFVILLILNVIYGHYGTLTVSRNTLLNYALPDVRCLRKSLGFVEDVYLNFTELTKKYNYPTKEHQIITEDGYILTLFRILPKCEQTIGYPIILLHGIYDSADTWILAGPQNSLEYVLANNCCDVWAANHRGNVYSRKHVTYDPNKNPKYWDYSLDEHGFFDLPAMEDYVISRTDLQKVNYIGHSQGTADSFVMASLRPQYNAKIQLSVHLAPVVFLKNLGSPILKLLAPAADGLKDALGKAGLSEILPDEFMEYSCHFAPDVICGTGLFATTGYKSGTISPRSLSLVGGHLFAGISNKSLAHLAQLISDEKFKRYDEGIQGNMQKYGTSQPLEYDLSLATSLVLLLIVLIIIIIFISNNNGPEMLVILCT